MNAPVRCRLGILLSGRGSNFAAIQEAIAQGQLPHAEIAVVISNHEDAPGLTLAQSKGLNTVALDKADFEGRAAFDTAIAEALKAHQVDLVVLAGYDRILSQPVLDAYPHRILNIHPSLLPAYGGKGMVGSKVHQAVIDGREATSGCTVHVVTDVVDGGAILGQSSVPVLDTDTPETLAARVLAQEHQLYPRMIGAWIAQNFLNKRQIDSHEHNALV
jgi:formyltetrahydrofolate-dependent phosphoribosylglycinamide formyltransferase